MAERQMQLEDWLDDLCVRFIINLPRDNLTSVERICFQIEEAQWFYEDFIRPLDPNLPSLSLRSFSLRMFAHCPLLSTFAVGGQHMQAFEEFLAYKNRIPVRGAIMLNVDMDATVLVKGWKKGANWSFPRGKINKDEDDLVCAIREVYEETGLDLEAAGLIPENRQVKHIEINIREQQMRLYVFKNVPMDTHFEPRTRKEISKIEWWRLSDLPAFKKKNQNGNVEPTINANKFYMVAPFLVPLRKWIVQQKQLHSQNLLPQQDDFFTEDDRGNESSVPAPYEVSAPESTSLEEAGEVLSRLLQINPNQSRPHDGLATQGTNSGSALLALLQNQPLQPVHAPNYPQPAVEQVQRPMPVPNPPFSHQLGLSQMPQIPQMPHMLPQQFPPQQFTRQYQDQPRFEQPQPRQVHHILPPSQVPGYQTSPHHNQSQHLIHPQPLPPNVQKAVFTGGAISSPPIPQSSQQAPPQWDRQYGNTGQFAQYPGDHVPNSQEIRRAAAPQLNSHSMALLNAFKTGGSPMVEHAAPAPSFVQPPSTIQGPQSHAQELPAEIVKPAPAAQSVYIAPATVQPSSNFFAPRKEVSPAQKSALLNMFKSPAAQHVVAAKISNATALPTSNTPSAVELSAVEPLLSNPTGTNDMSGSSRFNNRGPERETELVQTVKTVTILARPQVAKSDHEEQPRRAPRKAPTQSNNKQNAQGSGGRKNKVAETAPTKVFAPQILKRPQPATASEAAPSTLPSSKPAAVALQSSILEQQTPFVSKQPPPPEHRQNLLSLFGKPSPSSAAAAPIVPSPVVSRTSTLDLLSAISPVENPSKSRMGSIASAVASSRRGSSSTMSKANENFLLGYLDAIAGGGHR